MLVLLALGLAAFTCMAQDVQDVLNRYCVQCHSAANPTVKLNLQSPGTDPELWDKVLDKVATNRMPPPGLPAPKPEESKAVISWIEKRFARSAPDPGRITARRLNRAEYDNTIRDLLGVSINASAAFPVDDSGYGFDNIGDVLSVSPMLMEKYMSAARSIARVAVNGETYPKKPGNLTRLLAKRSHDAQGSLANSNYLPYSMRGSLYGTYRFPVDGEYELRLRVVNFRGQDEESTLSDADRERYRAVREKLRQQTQGKSRRRQLTKEEIDALNEEARLQAPPRKVILTVDGKQVLSGVVEGTTTFDYDRGEWTVRVPLKAGEHFLRASYPELADLEDPRFNLNRDMRRKLFIDYLDIVGPFLPSPLPPASYAKIFPCGHDRNAHQASCLRQSVTQLATRAFRRPATQDELSSLLALANSVTADGGSIDDAARVALQAMLTSPQFLFRIEHDSQPGPHAINEFELASRLSYFLWASMPDGQLMQLAAQSKLRTSLEPQVKRMLADPKSESLISNFFAQWLQLRNLDRTRPDPKFFPTVDDELLDAMRHETSLFLNDIIRQDRSLLDLIDAPFTYLNGPLARHYGISGITGEEFRRVDLDGSQRSGLLTQGSILTVSSYPARTSPVMRGKWVLENLLGTPPPAPPADVPQLEENSIGKSLSLRQQMEQHRANPACAVCHTKMDAIGFGMESYDAAGAWRTHEGKFPIDTKGAMPDGKSFAGSQDLKQILKEQSPAIARNIVEKTLTYALGRGLERTDRLTVEKISERLAQSNYRFSALLLEIARSAPFQMRNGEQRRQP